MKFFATPLLLAAGLFLLALPCSAQVAYQKTVLNSESTAAVDGEEKPAAPTYKLIHGVVQGAQGALPGATVALKGSRVIVVTNSEGEFELRVPAAATTVTLVCGYGGLQEEVVSMAPVKALGSIYLLRPSGIASAK